MTEFLNLELLINHLSEAIADKLSDRMQSSNVQTTTEEEQYLDTSETLSFIKVRQRITLQNYVKQGLIEAPIQRGGRKLYYKKSSLLNFLQNG
jgi:hypothetical protein